MIVPLQGEARACSLEKKPQNNSTVYATQGRRSPVIEFFQCTVPGTYEIYMFDIFFSSGKNPGVIF